MQQEKELGAEYLEKFLREISNATLERGGVTCNLHTYEFLTCADAWALPKYPERTVILPPEANLIAGLHQFIRANAADLYVANTWLGTWINPLTQVCHLDITEVFSSLEEAGREALRHCQTNEHSIVALYHFKCNQTVYLYDVLGQLAEESSSLQL